jgi:hypothetical protein
MVEGSSSLEHSFGDFENEHGGDDKLEEEECQEEVGVDCQNEKKNARCHPDLKTCLFCPNDIE